MALQILRTLLPASRPVQWPLVTAWHAPSTALMLETRHKKYSYLVLVSLLLIVISFTPFPNAAILKSVSILRSPLVFTSCE